MDDRAYLRKTSKTRWAAETFLLIAAAPVLFIASVQLVGLTGGNVAGNHSLPLLEYLYPLVFSLVWAWRKRRRNRRATFGSWFWPLLLFYLVHLLVAQGYMLYWATSGPPQPRPEGSFAFASGPATIMAIALVKAAIFATAFSLLFWKQPKNDHSNA